MTVSVPWGLVQELGMPPDGPALPPTRAVQGVDSGTWLRAYTWTRLMADAAILRSDVWQAAKRPVFEAPLMGAGFVRVPDGLDLPFPRQDGFTFGFCIF